MFYSLLYEREPGSSIIMDRIFLIVGYFLQLDNKIVDFADFIVRIYHIFFNIIIRLYTTGPNIAGR